MENVYRMEIGMVHNPDTVRAMARQLEEATAAGARVVVLESSHEKNWCIGIDVAWVLERYKQDDRKSVMEFFLEGDRTVFRTILDMPCIVIAAIGGHAIANGAVLACLADIRYMRADRGYFCLPEAAMGLDRAFPPSDMLLFRSAYGPFITDDLIPSARKVAAQELAAHGVIDRACAGLEELKEAVDARAREIAADRGLYESLLEKKRERNREVLKVLDAEDEAAFDFISGEFWTYMKKVMPAQT
ncbi:MAG: enoyl-CoA hydratase/isomerase family protein [Spirochaetes bacterium]|nr:enoyl-CoA hydratase/isomerase family protein [Spirochaetota bacterium]